MICFINADKLRMFNKKESIGLSQLTEHRAIIQKLWEASGLIHKYNRKINKNYYVIVGGNNSK